MTSRKLAHFWSCLSCKNVCTNNMFKTLFSTGVYSTRMSYLNNFEFWTWVTWWPMIWHIFLHNPKCRGHIGYLPPWPQGQQRNRPLCILQTHVHVVPLPTLLNNTGILQVIFCMIHNGDIVCLEHRTIDFTKIFCTN